MRKQIGFRTKASGLAIVLFVLGGRCIGVSGMLFSKDYFNDAAIMYLCGFLGIGMGALLDRNRS